MGATEVTTTRSETETAGVARRLAATLSAGDLLILTGTLGAGKTAFVRGLAEGLGIDTRLVHSPSFTILTEYPAGGAGNSLVHVDLYRLDTPAEAEDLGLGDDLGGRRVVAVEWGERLPARLRAGAIRVSIEDLGDDVRRVTIERP